MCMLIECYRCHMPIAEQDPLSIMAQRLGGWLSVSYIWVDYWVPEDRAYLLFLYDPNLERLPKLDYIV